MAEIETQRLARPLSLRFMSQITLLVLAVAPALNVFSYTNYASSVVAQGAEGAGAGADNANANPLSTYKCPTSCKPPQCTCASTSPPVSNPPQFVMLTFDDAIQSQTWAPAMSLLQGRMNKNNCPVKATWFTQTFYSDPYLVQQWYVSGNEVADHTVTHGQANNTHVEPFVGTYAEVEGMRKWANELAGIPLGQIKGFRHPFLNYSQASLEMLTKMGFEYESSMSAMSSDNVWPYTLDYGTVNDCEGQINLCGKSMATAGLWTIPMYSVFPTGNDQEIHLMDPFNDPSTTSPLSSDQVLQELKTTFDTRHYQNNRVPFGVYTHPIWLASGVASIPDGKAKLAAVAAFLDYALSQPDTYMVSNAQLVEYMKNPVSASDLPNQPYMQCSTALTASIPTNICNGLNTSTVQPETCNAMTGVVQGNLRTCFGCPNTYPSLSDPSAATTSTRCRLPTNCDTAFWDPVGCKCLCTGGACQYQDKGRPVNLDPNSLSSLSTGSGSKSANGKSSAASALQPANVAGIVTFVAALIATSFTSLLSTA